MRVLANSGLVVRRSRAGTFIADAEHLGSSVWHFRFHRPGAEELLPWVARVIAMDTIQGEGPWSDFLDLMPDYVRIRRIVTVAEELNLYAETYLEGPRFRPLLDIPMEVLSGKNLRVFIHERFNVPTFRTVHRITSTNIAADIAGPIGVAPRTHALDMKAFSYGFRDVPGSYQRIIIPDSPFELELLG